MRSNLENARHILENGDYTCVFYKGKEAITCTQRGVKPLLELLDAGKDLQGYSVADKVVGKAAAMLYACMHVKEVYAPVMSGGAELTLTRYGIAAFYNEKVERIQNRRGDGLCPMESVVWDIEDPLQALQILRDKIK